MQQFNTIENVNFTDADLTKYRAIALSTIASDPKGETKIVEALTWMGRQIERVA